MNDDLIYLSPSDEAKKTIEGRAIESGAGVSLVVETLRDQFPPVNDLRLYVQPTGIVLNLARRGIIS
jgi:hypothetical protein